MSKKILSLIFPKKCVLCGEVVGSDIGNGGMCPSCVEKFKAETEKVCSLCSASENKCNCATTNADAEAHLIGFNDDYSRKLIYTVKRKDNAELTNFLAKELSESVSAMLEKNGGSEGCTVTYVPRNPESVRDFGFDQAAKLAKQVAKLLGLPYMCLFEHEKISRIQKELGIEERIENARRSYSGKDGAVSPDKIIIIDDVKTTGSTLNRCVVLARGLGAKKVFIATVASAKK